MARKPGTSGNRFTDQRKELYLDELRRTGLKTSARRTANVSSSCIASHRKRYPEFAEAEHDALTAHRQMIHDEFIRRGIKGVKRPMTVAGESVDITEYSDSLLLAYAKRFDPEFRPQVKVEQKVEGSIAVGLEDLTRLDRKGRELLRQLLECPLTDEKEADTE